jgi:LuxR family maltose regulon positive regulatory protein
LIDELNKAKDRRLIMVLAPAGYGKTTLLSDWLASSQIKSGWLSLYPDHNDLAVFMTQFIAAIQTIDHHLCRESQMLLNGPHLPPLSHLAATLINDLNALTTDVVVALEDYHLIKDKRVHEFISLLITHAPKHLHLALSARIDPPLPLSLWRARGYTAELRVANLKFTHEEARNYLTSEMGVSVPEHVVDEMLSFTEGWITGLKLSAISIRNRVSQLGSAGNIEIEASDIQSAHADRHIAEYLLDDVFKRQPRQIQEFLMRTSILDQFTESLCDALGTNANESGSAETTHQARYVLKWIERSNLFLVPLDSEGHWFRYHHLFRELLAQCLRIEHDAAAIDALHKRAGNWLANAGLIDAAIQHYLRAGDPQGAADLIEAHRHALLDHDDWQALERWLSLLPQWLIEKRPDLLAARAWVLSFQGRAAAVGAAVRMAFNLLNAQNSDDPKQKTLIGELEVHRSHAGLISGQLEQALVSARNAVDWTPRDHSYVLGTAVTAYGLISQVTGNTEEALRKFEMFIGDDTDVHRPTALRALLTTAWMSCMSGDWGRALSIGEYGLKLSQPTGSVLLAGWSHLLLGWYYYEQNELDTAIVHFKEIAQHRYNGVHWRCAIDGLCGLGRSYGAQGEIDQAEEVARMLDEYTLETRDADPMLIAQAYRARLNLLEGKVAPALHWAQTSTTIYDFRPLLWMEASLITRIRAYAADGSKTSKEQAISLLQRAAAFAHGTQNVWHEVELQALQSLLLMKEGRHEAALDALDQALALARPGHFLRSFIDLGPDLGKLLVELVHQKRYAEYARELLIHIEQQINKPNTSNHQPGEVLIEPLTAREQEILNLLSQHLTNDEIAQVLFISPVTVKSHIRNLFEKLGVSRRRFAITRARELGLLA